MANLKQIQFWVTPKYYKLEKYTIDFYFDIFYNKWLFLMLVYKFLVYNECYKIIIT